MELRHYWATTPPIRASLDLGKEYRGIYDYDYSYGTSHANLLGATDGLPKFESIILECPADLDSGLLMQLLGNPNSVASNLKNLELRFCNLNLETIAKLLYHAPPKLERLVLLCWDSNRSLHGFDEREGPHLCPLIREFSKRLVQMEFAASTVCREIFFNDREMQMLTRNGVITVLGDGTGVIEGPEKLDSRAIQETVSLCRRQKRAERRNLRINEAIKAAKTQTKSSSISSSLFGGSPNSNASAAKAQRDTEALLDEEEEDRRRLIEGSKTRWFRRLISWHGPCRPTDTWAEIQLAADMEEQGVEWVVVSKFGQLIFVRGGGLV